MTAMNPVNWFEIPANDLIRASKFYEAILGVKLTASEMGPMKMAWFPMERNASGSAGTLIMAEGYIPSQEGSLVYFAVSSIENTLAKVDQQGGKTLVPKTSIGDYGYIAHALDSEGNRIGLHANS